LAAINTPPCGSFGRFLRSIKTDEDYLNKVKEEISTIKEKHRRDIFVIGGDFNLPDINWEEQPIFWAVSAFYII
jgi:hypothetical protein